MATVGRGGVLVGCWLYRVAATLLRGGFGGGTRVKDGEWGAEVVDSVAMVASLVAVVAGWLMSMKASILSSFV